MADAVRRECWSHTAELQAAIINYSFYRPPHPITSTQLNPFTRTQRAARAKSGGMSLADLKLAFLGSKPK